MRHSFLLVIAAVAISTISGRFLLGEFDAYVARAAVGTFLLALSLRSLNSSFLGHGIDGSPHILGMPRRLFAIYLTTLVMILFFLVRKNPALSLTALLVMKVMGISGLCGWVAGLLEWHMYSCRATYAIAHPSNDEKK